MKQKVLLFENIHPKAAKRMIDSGCEVLESKGAGMSPDLMEFMRDVTAIGIRSKTRVDAAFLQYTPNLRAIGAFCIGTDQIDLEICAKRGVSVFNAPYSNTRSVVELALGEMLMLMRNIPQFNKNMHEGNWQKSAQGSFELRGKRLGIIGYGNIGSQLSVLAEAMGLYVSYFDVVEKLALGNAQRASNLDELLRSCDIISVHVDGRNSNRHMLGEAEFSKMKRGSILLNLSRGHVVDLGALSAALISGHLAGAGIDVFDSEPDSNGQHFFSPLRNLSNVLLTPHIGGSTLEAQENIAHFVANKLLEYLYYGSTFGSVNFPQMQVSSQVDGHRLIHVHQNVPGVLAQINQLLAKNNINVLGQTLKTNEWIGYVVTDVNQSYPSNLIPELRSLPETIDVRVLS